MVISKIKELENVLLKSTTMFKTQAAPRQCAGACSGAQIYCATANGISNSISPQLFSSDPSPQSSLKSHTLLGSTHTLLLHSNIFSGHKGWGSVNEKKWINENKKIDIKTVKAGEKSHWAGGLPGKVQLAKKTSSMATCPCLMKLLEASNRMLKSRGTRPTVTSPWCHLSAWLPDSHHNVVVLGPTRSTTFRSALSEMMSG